MALALRELYENFPADRLYIVSFEKAARKGFVNWSDS